MTAILGQWLNYLRKVFKICFNSFPAIFSTFLVSLLVAFPVRNHCLKDVAFEHLNHHKML